MDFDRLAGTYVWCADNHGGQCSREYRVLSRISARGLKLSDSAFDGIRTGAPGWEAAHETYAALDADRAGD